MNSDRIEEIDSEVEALQARIRDAVKSGKQPEAEALFEACNGAEILVELFLVRETFPECNVMEVIASCCSKSPAREAYTFLLEVLSHADLSWQSKLEALPELQSALLRMTGKRQQQFVLNALAVVPTFFKKSDAPNTLEGLASFGTGFTESVIHLEEEVVGSIALEDGVTCYLFNLLPRLLPRIGPYPNVTADFEGCGYIDSVVDSLARLARKFLHSPPIFPYRETCGDGGGACEASPLSQATFVYLTETYTFGSPWARIARIISPQRRYLFIAWVIVVMFKHGYHNIAFQVFMEQLAPLFSLVQQPILDHQFYATVLEGLTQIPDHQFKPVEDTRPKYFSTWSTCVRLLPFRRRFETYLHIINSIKVDVLVGGVVTNARTDWWDYLLNNKETGNQEPALKYLGLQLVAATLGGKFTIVDGMDTLVAALNFVRLLLMSEKCKFILPEFLGEQKASYFPTPLEKLLQNIGSQVDYELRTAQNDAAKERIEMVAHLVARVRDLILMEKPQQDNHNKENGSG